MLLLWQGRALEPSLAAHLDAQVERGIAPRRRARDPVDPWGTRACLRGRAGGSASEPRGWLLYKQGVVALEQRAPALEPRGV